MGDWHTDAAKDERRKERRRNKLTERLNEIKSSLSDKDQALLKSIISSVQSFDRESRASEPLDEALSIIFDGSSGRTSSARTLLKEYRRLGIRPK